MQILRIVAPNAGGLRGSLLNVALLTLLSGPAVYWRFIAAIRSERQSAAPAKLGSGNFRFAFQLTAIAQVLGLLISAGGVWWQSANLDGLAQ